MSSNNQTNNQQSIYWRWQQDAEIEKQEQEKNSNQESIYWRWQQDSY